MRPRRRLRAIPRVGAVVLLLLVLGIPVFAPVPGPLGSVQAVVTQQDPGTCAAVGDGWTACDNATASDDVYAFSEDGPRPPAAAFQDGASVALKNTESVLVSTTVDRAGDHVVVASVQIDSTHTFRSSVAAGDLILKRDGVPLASNQFPIFVESGTDSLRSQSWAVVFYDASAPAGATYSVTATADASNRARAETKILVLLDPPLASGEDGGNVSVGTGETTVLSHASGLPSGENLVVGIFQLWSSTNNQTFAAGDLRLKRGGASLTASPFNKTVENGATSESQTTVLLARDVGAPAGATYNLTALANATGAEAEGKVVVVQGWAGAFLDGNATAVGTAETTLGSLSTGFPTGDRMLLAAQEYDETNGTARRIDPGNERLKFNGTTEATNQFALRMRDTEEADGKSHLLLWYQPAAPANATYNVTALADGTGIDAETKVLAVNAIPPRPPGKNDTAWRDFGFNLDPSDVVERVEVGVEWYRTNPEPMLNVTVTWDGGTTWSPSQNATNKSADDDTVEWLDFTGATAWTPALLDDAVFRVRVRTNGTGAQLDYVTVRLTVNVAPTVTDLGIEDGGGQSVAGEVLQVDTPYAFLFNVTDDDGWADIGEDGAVDLRLWYDGGGSPELAFVEQTGGPSYRIVLRYADTGDPGNASLSEWSVTEGQATYDEGASSQTPLFNGPTLVGYAFRLVLTLQPPVKGAADPANAGPGGYDDPDSWNAEVRADDGPHVVIGATTAAGPFLEFGVGPNAVLSYGATTPDATIGVNETTALRVTLSNAGPGNAGAVWANLSLAAELAYVSDDASAIGGVLTGTYDFRFDDLAPGDYVFNVTVQAVGGTPNGTDALANFSFESQDPLGDPLDNGTASVAITITNAIMTYDAVATEATVGVGDATELRFTIENNGETAAGSVWVNVTLPAELAYVSDDAAAIGGVLTGTYDFRFDGLAPGDYVFNVTVQAVGGVPNGTVATTNVTFESVDAGGASLESDVRDINVTVVNAVLSLSPGGPFAGDPGDEVILTLTVGNAGTVSAQNLRIDVVLDADADYVSSVPTGSYDAGTRTLRWTLASLNPGEEQSLEWTVVLATGIPDGAILTFPIEARGDDPGGEALPRAEDQAEITTTAPVFAPVLVLDRTEAEKGDVVLALLYFNNTGTGTALQGVANWSLGGHYALRSVVPAPSLELTEDGFRVELTNVTAGNHVLTVRLEVLRGMNTGEDGDTMGMEVTWSATDANGNPVHTSTHSGSVTLLAPVPSLSLTVSQSQADPDDVVLLNVTLRNDGGAPVLGWLNLSLPAGALYVGDNGTYSVSANAGRVSWTLPAIPADGRLTMQIEVQVTGSASVVPFRFSYNYTDGRGSLVQQRLSNSESVQVTSPLPGGLDPWLLILILVVGAVVLGLVLWFLWQRRGEPQIEEVFVGHRDGVLLSHQSRTLTPDKDNDILVAMFKTVTDFVQDAFSSREDVPMRSIRFGESNILVEHGTHHFVAVVYRGEENEELEARLAALSARIEEEFGDILAQFSGDMRETRGIRKLLPAVWGEGLEGEGPFGVASEPESSWLQRLRDRFRRESPP